MKGQQTKWKIESLCDCYWIWIFSKLPNKAPNQPCAKGTLPALSARHQSPPAMVSRWCSKRKDFFWFKAINSKAEKIRKGVYVYIYICYIIFIYVSKWSLDTPAIQPPWEVTLSSSWQCHPTSGRPPSWWNWEATHKNHTQPISTNCPSSNKNQHLKDSTHFTCEFCCTTCYCESICLGIPDSSLHVLHASMWEYAGSYHAMGYHHWGYACHATDLLPNSSPGPIQRHSDYKNAETIWQWRTAPSRNSYKPPKGPTGISSTCPVFLFRSSFSPGAWTLTESHEENLFSLFPEQFWSSQNLPQAEQHISHKRTSLLLVVIL